eukprot:GHVS01106603.1.p1 GENE.GHVS01106603.1~~GHVS01106603.1.p1  ORF type:complete len:197 (-),score=33.20 GHVS01106603.1:849-1439(-)
MYCFCASSFSIVPFICPITLFCSLIYPVYRSVILLYHPHNPATTITRVQEPPPTTTCPPTTSTPASPNFVTEYTQWLMFWMIFSLFSVVEHLLSPVVPFVPLFMEMKCILFLWLGYEEFQGAGWIWVAVAGKYYGRMDEPLLAFYHKHCPEAVKHFLAGPGGGGEKDPKKKKTTAGGFESAREAVGSVGVEGLKEK